MTDRKRPDSLTLSLLNMSSDCGAIFGRGPSLQLFARMVASGLWRCWLGGCLLGLASLAGPSSAQSGLPPAPYAYQQLQDPGLEAQARDLMHTLRCLVCQGQSIADSDAPLAGDMRSQVRERLLAGEPPEAIRSWLVSRYGSWVSYEPPLGADTLLLYLAPVIALIAGIGIAFGRVRWRSTDSKDQGSAA